jgi:Lipid A core - O-antigen ligase and related enzymes
MPFPRGWSLYALGAFLTSGLALWTLNFRVLRELFIRKLYLILPPVIYFFLVVVRLFFEKQVWSYIEGNLMFLLIPIIGFSFFVSDYFVKKKVYIVRFFIYGILSICVFEFLRAAWNSISFTDGTFSFKPLMDFTVSANSEDYFSSISRFRSVQLSFLENPIYLSMKIILAVVLMKEFRMDLKFNKPVQLFIFIIFLVFLYFLSSRIGYFLLLCILLYYIHQFFKRLKVSWIVIFLFPLVLFSAYKISLLNPRIRSKTDLFLKNYRENRAELKDSDPRFTSWFTTLQLIKMHPISGVGLNSKDILAGEYKKNGYKNEADLRLNAHNQFLETQLALGISGTLVLIWMLITPLIRRKKASDPSFICPFLIIITASMLFESILVRQWGIMFFVLFYCIFSIPEKKSAT